MGAAVHYSLPTVASPPVSTIPSPPESPDLNTSSNPLQSMEGFVPSWSSDEQTYLKPETVRKPHLPLHESSRTTTSCALSSCAGRQLTPPPSAPASPRRSLEEDEDSNSTGRRTRPRFSSAYEALSSALASEEECSSLFPRSFSRPLERTISGRSTIPRRTPSSTSSSEITTTTTTMTTRAVVDGQHPSNLPFSRSSSPGSKLVEYAPMAAGFARLSRKDAHGRPDVLSRMRTASTRPGMELEARMFDGPA